MKILLWFVVLVVAAVFVFPELRLRRNGISTVFTLSLLYDISKDIGIWDSYPAGRNHERKYGILGEQIE